MKINNLIPPLVAVELEKKQLLISKVLFSP